MKTKNFENILLKFSEEASELIPIKIASISKVYYDYPREIVYQCVINNKIIRYSYNKKKKIYKLINKNINEILDIIINLELYKDNEIFNLCTNTANEIISIFNYLNEIKNFSINYQLNKYCNFIYDGKGIKYSEFMTYYIKDYDIKIDNSLPYTISIIKLINNQYGKDIMYGMYKKLKIYNQTTFIKKLYKLLAKSINVKMG